MKNLLETSVKIFIVIAILYLVFNSFFNTSIDQEYKKSIDSLNTNIQMLEKKQDSLNQDIKNYQTEITKVDNTIQTIKNQKTIVKEYYHEKIISIDGFSRSDIDTFFTNRYGYNN